MPCVFSGFFVPIYYRTSVRENVSNGQIWSLILQLLLLMRDMLFAFVCLLFSQFWGCVLYSRK